jgi:UDP-2,4-diacetamido-2,4,6-trideoxy-beta-L-altropyranose hydrolase
MKSKAFFRVDSNIAIGSGHIMRCLSLAKALRQREVECTFITADCGMQEAIAGAGFANIALDTVWNDMESELPVLLPLVQKEKPNCVIADSYYITERWMQAVRKTAGLIYIDDLNAQCWPADILVNYNLYAPESGYKKRYAGRKIKLLLGASYAPLRDEFQALPTRKAAENVKNILVSAGGSDAEHITLYFLKKLRTIPDWNVLNFHFVVGALNPDKEQICELARQMPNVTIHYNVQRMSELMLSCDLAVAAAGSTLYELCACGTPTVTYVLADNQIDGAAAFERAGLMRNAGDWRTSPDLFEKTEENLRYLIASYDDRERMAQQMQKVVDGNGAARLAAALVEHPL